MAIHFAPLKTRLSTFSLLFLYAFTSLLTLSFSAKAMAACPGSDGSGSGIVFQSCTEVKISSNAKSMDLPSPANVNANDLLLAVITVDGDQLMGVPNGWWQIGIREHSATTVLFYRVVGENEPASYRFQWAANGLAYGYLMHFTGAGYTSSVSAFGTSSTVNFPSLDTFAEDTMILRVGGFDDDDIVVDPPTIVAGHSNITADVSGSGTGTVSGAAAYVRQAATGPTGTATMNLTSPQEWSAFTVALYPGSFGPTRKNYLCPGLMNYSQSGQVIKLKSCAEGKTSSEALSLTIDTPENSDVGDFMLAFISSDGSEQITESEDWVMVYESPATTPTFGLYKKFVTATEPASHSWSVGSNEQLHGYIVLIENASGGLTFSATSGDSTAPTAAPITTERDLTLVIQATSHDEADLFIDPSRVILGFFLPNIIADASSLDSGSVSSQAVASFVNSAGTQVTPNPFTLLDVEEWRALMVGVEPIEFRVSMPDGTASICGEQQVTVSITDKDGNIVPDYTGEIFLTTSTVAHGVWSDAGGLGGSLTSIDNFGFGNYTFAAEDNGVATFNFHTSVPGTRQMRVHQPVSGGGSIRSLPEFSPTLTIDDSCEYRISYEDGELGVCSTERVNVSMFDSDGNPGTHFTGSMDISSALANTGDYSLEIGDGTLENGVLDDGAATYTFAAADEGQVTLAFSDAVVETVNFDINTSEFPNFAVDPVFDPDLQVLPCELRFSHDATSDVCSTAAVTLSVTERTGVLASTFSGTVTLSNAADAGRWSINSAVNGLTDLGNGAVDYTFDLSDGGDIVLDFAVNTSVAALDFNASVSEPGYLSPVGAFDPPLEVLNCSAVIVVPEQGNVCDNGTALSLEIRNRDNDLGSAFAGVLTLSNNKSRGDYSTTTGAGTLLNGSAGDGVASYEFALSDAGRVDLVFESDSAESLSFLTTSPHVNFNADESAQDLQVLRCEFRIEHSGNSDICSDLSVTISVFNELNVAVSDYVGTVNLSTDSGDGSWANDSGSGSFVDPAQNDGSASYTFVLSDAGTATLRFTTEVSEALNFNVADGITTDSNAMYDPDLQVADCEFRITLATDRISACGETSLVTITAVDSAGATVSDFAGTLTLSSDSLNGDWAVPALPLGTFINSVADDGMAGYEFSGLENGQVSLLYASTHPGVVNFDIVSGSFVVDGNSDPSVEITGCLPVVVNSVCERNQQSANLTISTGVLDPEYKNRMVIMLVYQVGTLTVFDAPTFDGAAMTLIEQVQNPAGEGTSIEMWGLLDADLPLSSGSYSAAYALNGTAVNQPSMCLLELSGVAQQFPQFSVLSPNQGPVNTSTSTSLSTPQELQTSITTTMNNSLVLSAGLSDFSAEPNSWFDSIRPNPPMSIVVGEQSNDARPQGGTAVGSAGRIPAAGFITISDIDNEQAVSGTAHLVASFNPLIDGPPLGETYEAINLFDTFSGNLNYVAIGNTSRRSVLADCQFVSPNIGTAASLNLPSGAAVKKAYLYWSGSGSRIAGTADSQVDFGPIGSELSITADQLFAAEGFIAGADFFAGYKDVTAQVSSSGLYRVRNLQLQSGMPWNPSLCAGGWSLVVIYEHPNERLRVLNLFHGIQPLQYSELTLTPRNFRLSAADGQFEPNGQITHFTIEGDPDPADGIPSGEGQGVQQLPGSEAFTGLTNQFQSGADGPDDFNSTISRPIYTLNPTTGYLEFDASAGVNGDGYEADSTQAYGIDIDTHYLSGANPGDVLYSHASVPGFEAESLTTRYQTENDFVLLVNEIVSLSSTAVADIELTVSQSGEFIVGATANYHFEIMNNGDATPTGGFASGEIRLEGIVPDGLSIASMRGEGWLCAFQSDGGFSCYFDIGSDCSAIHGCAVAGELAGGQALPTVTATIVVGDSNAFPLLNNEVRLTGRVLHSGGSCGPSAIGLLPAPNSCDRSPQFDNVFDLQEGAIDINDLLEKSETNNNVDSLITDIRGNVTDLSIDKALSGILEEGGTASYALVVTNNGPGTTTADIVVQDTQPAGIVFTEASGPGWSCSLAPMICTHSASLLPEASTAINLIANVTGPSGSLVSNTATVESGAFDFDTNDNNNADTDISQIVPTPVAANERFLLSVSSPGGDTAIGSLSQIENDDFFIFDPFLDVADDFYNNSVEGFDLNEADAVHLFDNGKIALSASQPSTIGSNTLAFQPEDIVIYDPIIRTASLLFDGSEVFFSPVDGNDNVDAIYISDDLTEVYLSTSGSSRVLKEDAQGAQTSDTLFERGDIVRYHFDPNEPTSVVLDASQQNVFGAEVQVDGLYRRVDANDHRLSTDVFVLSIDEDNLQTIGSCANCNPASGTTLSRDDIVEYELTSGSNLVTELLFEGDRPLGVFATSTDARSIDAIHVVEEGDLGHFSISQSQAGSTCAAGEITISKHEGLGHTVDQTYTGSIQISTNTSEGDWNIAQGEGTLNKGFADDGLATYTFVPADNGRVTLFLSESTPSSINVDVTNGVVRELGTEDPNFDFNHVLTTLSFRDEFNASSFSNNDGSGNWADDWVEVDDIASGPVHGNVRVSNGQLRLTSNPNSTQDPALSRVASLATFALTEDVILRYAFSYQFLNSSVDQIVIEARPSASHGFVEVHNHAGIGGSNLIPAPVTLNLTTLLGDPVWSNTAEVRIRINAGYTGTSVMFFDNIELSTETTACDVAGGIDHYEIRIDGITRDATNPIAGIQCLGSIITVTPHNIEHLPAIVEEQIILQNSRSKGDWTLLQGSGDFNNGGLGDGTAVYNYSAADSTATFRFNYTDPSSDPELVNFEIGSVYGTFAGEDPTLAVQSAGLLFFNETGNSSLDPFPLQIAGKPSNVGIDSRLITLEAVRSSDAAPDVCLPLVAPGNTVDVEFGLECMDPATCATSEASINSVAIPVTDDNGADTVSSYGSVALEFSSQLNSGHSAAEVVFAFADVGIVQLHARMDIALNNDPEGQLSGDKLYGYSNSFVVRPFAFDVDFSGDRALNGRGASALSFAETADSSIFATAGEDFSVTVSAVAWQAEDDVDGDGVMDFNFPLEQSPLAVDTSDNAKTPNYGNESFAGDYLARLIPFGDLPQPVHTNGEFSQKNFDQVIGGEQTQLISYSEVGIVDIFVLLTSSSPPFSEIGYLTGPSIFGLAENVGRFVPDHFSLENALVLPRPRANANPACISPSNFNYLGEEFGVEAAISARNRQGAITQNYSGEFAKLGVSDFDSTSFAALAIQPGPDVSYSDRLSITSLNLVWNPHVAGPERGVGMLSGKLILNRQMSGVEDGPFAGLTIALGVEDSDAVGLLFDLDSDDLDGADLTTLGSASFRYGRLRLEDALGPETEPLEIGVHLEQWNGSAFETNTDDDCTSLFYNASQALAGERTFHFVPGSFLERLAEGDSIVEREQVLANSDLAISLFNGRNILQAEGEKAGLDRLIEASAPGEGREGSGLLEFDLSSPVLPYPLDFLGYDWRTPGADPLTEEAGSGDGIYSDNPRVLLEFNQYRGHDRIINWQEIYSSQD